MKDWFLEISDMEQNVLDLGRDMAEKLVEKFQKVREEADVFGECEKIFFLQC